jgi:hypothetical protein
MHHEALEEAFAFDNVAFNAENVSVDEFSRFVAGDSKNNLTEVAARLSHLTMCLCGWNFFYFSYIGSNCIKRQTFA